MNEINFLDTIFGTDTKFKNKYPVRWCELCNVAIISCAACHNSSCNGGGCVECVDDFNEFSTQNKIRVTDYLTAEEKIIYEKCERLKDLIQKTLSQNQSEIDFAELKKNGELSRRDEELFSKELNDVDSMPRND